MTGILLTQNGTPIIGDVAKLMGWIMNALFNFLDGVFGIQNIGLCIILFTIIIYLLMLPLTIKQQKFSKFSAKMNPELTAIRKKYENKKDEASMMAMNESCLCKIRRISDGKLCTAFDSDADPACTVSGNHESAGICKWCKRSIYRAFFSNPCSWRF